MKQKFIYYVADLLENKELKIYCQHAMELMVYPRLINGLKNLKYLLLIFELAGARKYK